jgi:hypothetical protein
MVNVLKSKNKTLWSLNLCTHFKRFVSGEHTVSLAVIVDVS